VVANFVNNRNAGEMALRQFSLARQFFQPLFKQLEDKTGINLENAVYYKGQAQHYIVMTPTKRSLVDLGVLREAQPASGGLLDRSNVSTECLAAMAKQVGMFFDLPTVLCESQGVMIFDFSDVQRLE
ncbi:unnamed protein product, partial [Polarella glacialis]